MNEIINSKSSVAWTMVFPVDENIDDAGNDMVSESFGPALSTGMLRVRMPLAGHRDYRRVLLIGLCHDRAIFETVPVAVTAARDILKNFTRKAFDE